MLEDLVFYLAWKDHDERPFLLCSTSVAQAALDFKRFCRHEPVRLERVGAWFLTVGRDRIEEAVRDSGEVTGQADG